MIQQLKQNLKESLKQDEQLGETITDFKMPPQSYYSHDSRSKMHIQDRGIFASMFENSKQPVNHQQFQAMAVNKDSQSP